MHKPLVKIVILLLIVTLTLPACNSNKTQDDTDKSSQPELSAKPEAQQEEPPDIILPDSDPPTKDEDTLDSTIDAENEEEEPAFIATKQQLLPPDEQIFDSEFADVYNRFVSAVDQKDLSVIDGFLADETMVSLGEYRLGKVSFYKYWELDANPEQSELWAVLEEIIHLGGLYYPETKTFWAPYTFTDVELNGYEYYIVIDRNVKAYASPDSSSEVIEYLNYNILKVNELPNRFWEKTDQYFIRITTPSGITGYIQKMHIRSPIDYRLGIECDENGDWKLSFLIAGD